MMKKNIVALFLSLLFVLSTCILSSCTDNVSDGPETTGEKGTDPVSTTEIELTDVYTGPRLLSLETEPYLLHLQTIREEHEWFEGSFAPGTAFTNEAGESIPLPEMEKIYDYSLFYNSGLYVLMLDANAPVPSFTINDTVLCADGPITFPAPDSETIKYVFLRIKLKRGLPILTAVRDGEGNICTEKVHTQMTLLSVDAKALLDAGAWENIRAYDEELFDSYHYWKVMRMPYATFLADEINVLVYGEVDKNALPAAAEPTTEEYPEEEAAFYTDDGRAIDRDTFIWMIFHSENKEPEYDGGNVMCTRLISDGTVVGEPYGSLYTAIYDREETGEASAP